MMLNPSSTFTISLVPQKPICHASGHAVGTEKYPDLAQLFLAI
jgi:hypothetical protein